MGSKKLGHAPGRDSGPTARGPSDRSSYTTVFNMQSLVWCHADFIVVGLEFLSSHKFGSVTYIDFPVMILTSTACIIHLSLFGIPSVLPVVWLWISASGFHQLLNEGSIMTVVLFTSLITREAQLRHPLHYC